ncbi:MAG: hypothetical protein ACI9XO_002818 [Paraglaciecola sp.]|jgi:hypothetical protein
MKLFYKLLIIFCLPFFNTIAAQSQDVWTDVDMAQTAPGRTLDLDYTINDYRALSLDLTTLRSVLRDAPMEFSNETPLTVEFPMANGEMEAFAIVESPIMEAGLAAKFPAIKTFAGRSLSNPANRIRLDYNNENFNAIILTTEGTTLIAPFDELNDYYISFRIQDVSLEGHDHGGFRCELHEGQEAFSPAVMDAEFFVDPTNTRDLEMVDLQTYRYAVSTTGEYSNGPGGGNVTSVMNNVATITNQLNGVFEVEAAIRFLMIDNTDELFFFDANDDPFDNGNLPTMIQQNQLETNNTIGVDNYDLGHVYGTNSGGLASLASVCNNSQKARAGSAPFGTSSGSLFYLTIAHEIGHQFNATHTFNLCDGDNETPGTGYESGAGITIMSYSGASNCGFQWIANISDNYFHNNSLERMKAFSRDANSGGSCDVAIAVGNEMPTATVTVAEDLYIPISTPFVLTGEATDPDNTNLTYCWEQYDLGDPSTLGQPAATAPLFRSYPPTTNSTRIIPRLVDLVDNANNIHEVLPENSRDITFRMTVRDNDDEAGAHDFDEIIFESTSSAGPFLVTNPNAGTESWEVGDYLEVTWDVANSDNDLVNCQNVNIALSMDGGFTYPMMLLAGTANDGSAFINVPDAITAQARIRVAAADNIFFDISNENFAIVPAANDGFSVVTEPQAIPLVCLPEMVNIEIATGGLVDFAGDITFSVESGLPTDAIATFSQDVVTAGASTTLTLDLSSVTEEGFFAINIQGEADGVGTEIRTVELNLVSTDFSDLEGMTPNASGTGIFPMFTWVASPNADSYEVQVSTSPTFDNIILTDVTTMNSITFISELAVGTQYFWRVRPSNQCGSFDYAATLGFQTAALVCNEITSTDTPLNIPATGNPTINSTVNVTDFGMIADLNIKNIQGIHNQFRDIEFILTGPTGETQTFLDSDNCSSALAFDFGMDDEAINPIACPPTGGTTYMTPGGGTLAAFYDTEVNGTWTLGVRKANDIGEQAGLFDSWTLEYCGSFPAADPFVVVNEGMCVMPLGDRVITIDLLNINDDDNGPADLVFTIVAAPTDGTLSLNGTALGVSDTFIETDIFNGNVAYANTNDAVLTDAFSFTVTDGNGGFLGTPTFDIEILDDAGCITGINDLNVDADISLYPNPAKEMVFVEFKQLIVGQMTANVIDVQGRILASYEYDNVVGKIEINTASLASGVYFISFQTEDAIFTKKVTIE